jgi:hypothetical protein
VEREGRRVGGEEKRRGTEKDKLTGHIGAFGAELNHDCQTNNATDQRAVIVYISTCSCRNKEGMAKTNLHDPEEGSKSNTNLLSERQLQSADLVERKKQDEQVGDHVGNLHAVVEGHQIDTFAPNGGFPSLVDGCAYEHAGEDDGSAPHDHDGDQDVGHEFEVVVREETAVLIENGELGKENTERVLDNTSVLDLQNLGEIGGADFLHGATNAMFNDCMGLLDRRNMNLLDKLTQGAADVETDLEELQFLN